jgi:hypothetical protein
MLSSLVNARNYFRTTSSPLSSIVSLVP